MDWLGLAALGLVGIEFLLVGYLSGASWPGPTLWAPRIALSVLAGAFLVAFAQLLLSLAGFGFSNAPLVLLLACLFAVVVRIIARSPGAPHSGLEVARRELI